MAGKKILYISQEISPYLPENDLSVATRAAAEASHGRGYEVRMFMPKYGRINERRNQLHEVIRLSGMNIIIDDTDHPLIIKVATLPPTRMQVYFIDNDDYFTIRATNELETQCRPDDNDERVIFFARGVIETVRKLRWEPSVVHVQGWVSALAPLYIKRMYADDPSFRSSKIVFSLLNQCPPAPLAPAMRDKLLMDGFDPQDLAALGDGPIDCNDLYKIGIDFADAVVQGDPMVDPQLMQYAKDAGKPVLEFPGNDNFAKEVNDFYDNIL